MVFSQWCALSLKQKTIDPFVEDSYRITVRRDGSRSFCCFHSCITWKSLLHVINVVTLSLRLHSSLFLGSSLWWTSCTDRLKSERHVSNRIDGRELPCQCPNHFSLLHSGCLVD